MKYIAKTLAIATLVSAPIAAFSETHRFYDYAKVKNVTPTYQTFEHRIPNENCWVERVRTERNHRGNRSATSTVVGGIIGGAIGHAVGHGKDNKKIGAVVGSVLGASIGNDIGKQKHRSHHYDVGYEDVERCEVEYSVEREERHTGYDVTYQYRGEVYTTHMDEHPGKRIKVSVSLSPVAHY